MIASLTICMRRYVVPILDGRNSHSGVVLERFANSVKSIFYAVLVGDS